MLTCPRLAVPRGTHARHAARTGHVHRVPARRWGGRRPTNLCRHQVGQLPAKIISVGVQKQLRGHAPGGISVLICRLHRPSDQIRSVAQNAPVTVRPSLSYLLPASAIHSPPNWCWDPLYSKWDEKEVASAATSCEAQEAKHSIPMLREIWDWMEAFLQLSWATLGEWPCQ